jgi:spermidine synthase
VVDATSAEGAPIDAFAIGGGGYAFPRYLDVTHPGSVTVAEIDSEVTRTAIDELGLQVSDRMHLVTRDARVALEDADDTFDLVLGDAFNDFGVPFHLTTREFNELVLLKLRPDGRYLLNVVDAENHDLLRSVIRTMQATFPEVDVVAQPGDWPLAKARGTFVIVGSRVPLPSGSNIALDRSALDAFVRDGRSELLTDDHAPVEQLIAPVFAQAIKDER